MENTEIKTIEREKLLRCLADACKNIGHIVNSDLDYEAINLETWASDRPRSVSEVFGEAPGLLSGEAFSHTSSKPLFKNGVTVAREVKDNMCLESLERFDRKHFSLFLTQLRNNAGNWCLQTLVNLGREQVLNEFTARGQVVETTRELIEQTLLDLDSEITNPLQVPSFGLAQTPVRRGTLHDTENFGLYLRESIYRKWAPIHEESGLFNVELLTGDEVDFNNHGYLVAIRLTVEANLQIEFAPEDRLILYR